MTPSKPTLSDVQLLREMKPELHVLNDPALNAEARPELLDEPLTPIRVFFVRNNGSLSPPDDGHWTLSIDGEVDVARSWTVPELRASFETVPVTAVLECAGNGRSRFQPRTDGLQWTEGGGGLRQVDGGPLGGPPYDLRGAR